MVEDPLELTEIASSESVDKPDYIIKRPYLHPRKKSKGEEIKLLVISLTEPAFSIYGGGKGWNVEYVDAKNKRGFWNEQNLPPQR
jgi:hypothetical protein